MAPSLFVYVFGGVLPGRTGYIFRLVDELLKK